MAKTRSMTRNQNHDDAPGRKRIRNHDASSRNSEGVSGHWSDLAHDVLLLVMMRLGVVDFIAFSGVCKTWRSLAIPNRKMFMVSRPPMNIGFPYAYEKTCFAKDFDGRMFKTVIPRLFNRRCVGVTCGYLILSGGKTCDFWLVNLVTRHQLHFPSFPDDVPYAMNPPSYLPFKAILMFLPSTSEWLFAITHKMQDQIWYSRAGEGVWNHVSNVSKILDLQAFKGNIYALILIYERNQELLRLSEIRLGLEPKFMVLGTMTFPCIPRLLEFVYSSENLLVKRRYLSSDLVTVHQFDFGEMKWVFREKTMEEYEFYTSCMYQNTAVKRESWWAGTDKLQKDKFFQGMWYFPHDCLNVNLMDE